MEKELCFIDQENLGKETGMKIILMECKKIIILKNLIFYIIFRVMFRRSDGTVKEEIWEDKDHEEEQLVKMGSMDNFHSLLGEVI